MRILIIGCVPGIGLIAAMESANGFATRADNYGTPPLVIQSPDPNDFKAEEYCDFRRDNREYDQAINREQSKRHEARFPKWTHQKRLHVRRRR